MHTAAAVPFSSARASAVPATAAPAGILVATAATPLVLWGLGWLGVGIPFAQWLSPALSLVAIVLVLVWLHGTFTAMRGRTTFSPGMAVGGWFIPIANLFLPALILRDAWRASVGRGGGLAFVWMIAWWLTTALSVARGLGLEIFSVDRGPVHVELMQQPLFEVPGISMQTFSLLFSLASVGIHVAAYGLLAAIVLRVGRGPA